MFFIGHPVYSCLSQSVFVYCIRYHHSQCTDYLYDFVIVIPHRDGLYVIHKVPILLELWPSNVGVARMESIVVQRAQ